MSTGSPTRRVGRRPLATANARHDAVEESPQGGGEAGEPACAPTTTDGQLLTRAFLAQELLEAPMFHPSAAEFENPMEYILSIRETAERFGICWCSAPAPYLLRARCSQFRLPLLSPPAVSCRLQAGSRRSCWTGTSSSSRRASRRSMSSWRAAHALPEHAR